MQITIGRRIRHFINPMNLFAILYRKGLTIKKARVFCLFYEQYFFNPLIRRFDAKPENVNLVDHSNSSVVSSIHNAG